MRTVSHGNVHMIEVACKNIPVWRDSASSKLCAAYIELGPQTLIHVLACVLSLAHHHHHGETTLDQEQKAETLPKPVKLEARVVHAVSWLGSDEKNVLKETRLILHLIHWGESPLVCTKRQQSAPEKRSSVDQTWWLAVAIISHRFWYEHFRFQIISSQKAPTREY